MLISQRSLQIELIFRLLLKITVERPHECDFDLICARREPVKQNDPPPIPPPLERRAGAIMRRLCLQPPVWGWPSATFLAVGRGNARL